jgi:hypothetical protein
MARGQAAETLHMMLKQHERAAADLQRRVQQQPSQTATIAPVASRRPKSSRGPSAALRASYASLGRDGLRCSVSSVNVIPPRQMNRVASAQSNNMTSSMASLPAITPLTSLPAPVTGRVPTRLPAAKANSSSGGSGNISVAASQPLPEKQILCETQLTGQTNPADSIERSAPSWEGK